MKKAFIFVFPLVLILVGVLVYLYLSGYRVGKDFSVERPVFVEIRVPYSGSEVFYNNSLLKTTTKDDEIVSLSGAKSSDISIIVSKTGFWPYKKDIKLNSNKFELEPFMLPMNVTGENITGADPEYERIKQIVTSASLPTIESKKISPNGDIEAWVEGGTLKISSNSQKLPQYFCENGDCKKEHIVLESKTPIRSLDFYKNRDDVFMVSVDDSVYAIEADSRGVQNFQPIFRGGIPLFAKSDNGLFIISGDNLLEIKF